MAANGRQKREEGEFLQKLTKGTERGSVWSVWSGEIACERSEIYERGKGRGNGRAHAEGEIVESDWS